MRKLHTIFFAILCCIDNAHASTLDQYNLYETPAWTSSAFGVGGALLVSEIAQSFSVGQSGILDAIELQLYAPAFGDRPPLPFSVSIFSIAAGVPTGSSLGSVYVEPGAELSPNPLNPTNVVVDFSGQNIGLDAGQELAIVLSPMDANVVSVYWVTNLDNQWAGNPYDSGQALLNFVDTGWFPAVDGTGTTDADFAFATYMCHRFRARSYFWHPLWGFSLSGCPANL